MHPNSLKIWENRSLRRKDSILYSTGVIIETETK